MFGAARAYGIFVRHAKDIKISDVEFNFAEPDDRPGIIFDDIAGIDLRNVTVQRMENSAAIVLKNVTNFSILQSKGIKDLEQAKVMEKEL
jgi:hypothetical protein